MDAPEMDRLGGLLRCGIRELHLALHCQSSRERRSSVVLHVISNEKENLRAEVDAADLQPDAQPTNRRNRSKSYKPGTDNTRKN